LSKNNDKDYLPFLYTYDYHRQTNQLKNGGIMSIRLFVMLTSLTFLSAELSAQDVTADSQDQAIKGMAVTILILDGSELTGVLEKETEEVYTLKTPAGIVIEIPKDSIVRIKAFEGKIIDKKIFRADPNKSLYLFSPSAFPIGKKNKYCRDFCLFFPSFNYGWNDVFSLQAGAFWVPGLKVDQIPLIGSIKATLYQQDKIALAAGIMYIKLPTFEFEDEDGADDEFDFGAGFTFVTGTYGDRFSHGSISLGWGFVQAEGEWEFMNRPIIVLAGNKRISNTIAIVTENWIPPEAKFSEIPMSLSARFFGKRLTVDVGILFVIDMLEEGLPFPLLNFTYHFK
jgi:hypothetical protein